MEKVSASLRAAQVGGSFEDMVQDLVDAIGVAGRGFAIDFHEEIDRSVVLLECSGVPGPGCEVRVGVEGDGAFAYCEARFDESIDYK